MNCQDTSSKSPVSLARGAQRWRTVVCCLALAAMTIGAFSRTFDYGFVGFDDNLYVFENPIVARGLTLKGLVWAFRDNAVDYWHPLTWLSHMADCQFFALRAGDHHLVNVLLHAATAVLLFLSMRELTGHFWRSAFIAAVFAVHPLRVESVAWIAERKDVLSGVFLMLALWAYARYAHRPSGARYCAVVVWFGLGLMCKNTLVTLPFVLLLLDWWPLQRAKEMGMSRGLFFLDLVKEKIPLFLMSIASCVMTVLAPQDVAVFAQTPFWQRLGNAVVSYFIYLREFFFPANLATPYPPITQPAWMIIMALALLAAITVAALALRKKQPYLLVGWLWFIGMLVPMIGIFQISDQAHADRFTYLPGIGLAIAATWAVGDWLSTWKHSRGTPACLSAAVLGVLMICTWKQTSYWQNSEALARRALVCTTNNYVAHLILGNALSQQGYAEAAADEFQLALQINPNYAPAQNNLGNLCLQKNEVDEAVGHFEQALSIRPDFTQAHENLADAFLREGRVDEAITHYERALQIYPDYAEANYNLGNAFFQKGRVDDAITHYERALQLQPENEQIQKKLVWTLSVASLRRGSQAVEWAQQASALTGGTNPVILHSLASALARAGRFPEAANIAEQALPFAEAQSNAVLAAQLQKELKLYGADGPPLR